MYRTRTTLSEISKALNLSVSTVSKSLADSSEISALTKRKVKDFAKKCNYVPNNFAASFRKGYTKTIGLIIPNINNTFFSNILVSVENYLDTKDYKLITAISHDIIEKENKSIDKMLSGYVDGIVMCVSKEAILKNEFSHIEKMTKQNIPLVIFDRICDEIDCDRVMIDDYQAAFDMTKLLLEKENCEHIVMTSLIDDMQHGKLRAKGFNDAFAEEKNTHQKHQIVAKNLKDLKEKIYDYAKDNRTIDGIFGLSEQAVIQAMHAKRQLIKDQILMNDITIAGFCNAYQSEYDPSIIAIDQNADKIGIEASRLLLNRIKHTEFKAYCTETVPVSF